LTHLGILLFTQKDECKFIRPGKFVAKTNLKLLAITRSDYTSIFKYFFLSKS